MTMLPVFCVLVLSVCGALGTPLANHYFDSVLNTALQNELRNFGLDPAPLSDFTTKFEDKVTLIGKVKGQANYTNGNLTGLSKASRHYECNGPYYAFGNKNLNCTLVFHDLKVNYNGKVKYGKLPNVNMKGKGNVTGTTFFVEVASVPGYPANVKNFLYQYPGLVNVTFTGLGPLNKFMKVLEDGYKSNIGIQLNYAINQRFRAAFERAVASIPLPN